MKAALQGRVDPAIGAAEDHIASLAIDDLLLDYRRNEARPGGSAMPVVRAGVLRPEQDGE